jgi:nucleoside-diphosphate-sugar epimerase
MRLFVTGGTGFVGTHFLQQALAAGHQVVALRRPGSQPRLPLVAQPLWVDAALDDDGLAAHLAGCDALVHLASHTPNPPYAPLADCLYWNVFAALKLAAQAQAAGVQRYLVAGSCFEYGPAAAQYQAIPTDAPLQPSLSYPTSKAAASLAFEGFARQHGVQLQILRIFQVYGEGEQAGRLWPSLRRAALAGEDLPMTAGAQVRDFIEVGDVARQFLHALATDVPPGQPVVRHVASGQPTTLRAFAEHWWAHWGATGRLLPGAVPYRASEMMRLVPAMPGRD